jgi:hypothetical protein
MENSKFKRTVYTVSSFLNVEVSVWGTLLKQHHVDCMHAEASYSQRKAWLDCFTVLRSAFTQLRLTEDLAHNTFVVFNMNCPESVGDAPMCYY